jgi:hypothetical protein
MLERLFPRTAVTASLQTARRAAQLEHDRRIGKSGVFHLFRLPSGNETALLDLLAVAEMDARLRELAEASRDNKLQVLAAMAGSQSLLPGEGPVLCGVADDLQSGEALRMCAVYYGGFRANQAVYPYVVARSV